MLSRQSPSRPSPAGKISLPAAQRGVVLMVALIILVALTLGGLALVRSVGTTNIIAGNLAFQQAATHASQSGIEDGIANFLEANDLSFFQADAFTQGYAASAPTATDPANAAAWETYWRTVIDPPGQVAATVLVKTCSPACANCGRVCRLPTDANTGNTVSYTIQRLCQTPGDPMQVPTGCASGAQRSTLVGASLAAGAVTLPMITQYYYRITTRTVGPRNTVSYVQTIVAK
jgi:type IV pilus assembly protein PilX